jgi:hypothetical protein
MSDFLHTSKFSYQSRGDRFMAPSKNIPWRLISTLSGDSTSPKMRRPRQSVPTLVCLEDRVVLSHIGISRQGLSSNLSKAQSAQTSATGSTASLPGGNGGGCGVAGGVQDAQLAQHQQTLQTDLNAALAGSTVTDAQRLALKNDLRAIVQAGVTVNKTALATVADSLLTALANGTYDANQASIRGAFTAAFTGASGAALTTDQAALVATAYGDFVTVARGLNLDSTGLTTLATDRAAIQADLTRLGITSTNGHAQSSNLDLIVSLGFGGGRRGRRF